MYDLMKELKELQEKLAAAGDHKGVQAVSQARVRIENLTYDIERYKGNR